ncbi:exocyst complex component 2-like [Liolophura sinensis]|uniref:exocyst complex component 2-like n=1 Tax=Liolophura sinensis TaxID=3198878 RepID=UPI003158F466
MSGRALPLVTGLSPKEGPPGTRITIRGENLGTDPKDLIGLKICGVDCLLSAEWKSPSKIVARTGPGKGKGDIIVITRSGGKGTCTVGFRGYFLQTGPLQESAVWIDEAQTVQSTVNRGRTASPIFFLDNENPLGISDEGRQNKFTEEDMLELFPEASGNLSLENFNAAWFLVENHYSTSFDDLKAGLAHMKRRASHRSEGPIAFVKSNLTATLDCQDSLDRMYIKFDDDKIKDKSMNAYAVLLMQAKSCADGLFKEVLGRKDKADSTRNALSVLQRFKFLFYLPLNIERNIQKGDYNFVINDYIRAKSLFGDTHVQVFKKVYIEVEKRIGDFKVMLHKKLMELPNTLEEQKRLIKYLANLEASGDPALECLENQQKWLMKLLTECRDAHIAEEQTHSQASPDNQFFGSGSQSGQRRNVPVPSSPGPSQRKFLTSPVFPRAPSFTSLTSPEPGWKFKPPQRVQYVEELTDIMIVNFPDLWKLCQAYFGGSLLLKDTGEKAFKVDTGKHSSFKQIITEMVRFFTNMIRAAFLPESLENLPKEDRMKFGIWPSDKRDIPGTWLPHCVRYIRSCVSSLSKLDLPSDSLEIINELAFDMRTNCMVTLLKQAIQEVRSLHTRETWSVETDDESGGTTQLPALFENIVNEAIQHLHEVVVQIKTGEQDLFSQRPIQKETTGLCTKLLQAFSDSLERLAFDPDNKDAEKNKLPGIVILTPETESSEDTPIPPLDRRLIVMLSNCNYTIERVIPRLVENLDRHGYVQMTQTLKEAQDTYRALDNKLFEAYVEEKSNPIIGTMEQNMYLGQFDWNQCGKPKGVRSYLKQVIMGMIQVHAEVFSVSPIFLTRVLSKLTEAISEEMSRLVSCTTGFNNYGILQARLEISAFQETISLYKTPAADSSLKEALEALPSTKLIGPKEEKLVDDLLNTFKSRMKFQLMCFSNDTMIKSSVSNLLINTSAPQK